MCSAHTKAHPRQPWAAAIAAKPPARTAKPTPKTQAAGYVPVNNFNSQQLQTALAAKFKQIEAQVGPGGVYHGSSAWTTRNKKRKGLDRQCWCSKFICALKFGTGNTSYAYFILRSVFQKLHGLGNAGHTRRRPKRAGSSFAAGTAQTPKPYYLVQAKSSVAAPYSTRPM
ncbi:hypothetical protein KL906_003092 [Ogataea polymorpha]|nr:hypothetical protein KL908_000804 [Ogataea polymorpha]KAG7908861.1 hypothetical protein KL906_003092 [Ogataea polymorpha]KAG7920984.1 hypothetical protein KL927_000228 [Ogataea polymorpha]